MGWGLEGQIYRTDKKAAASVVRVQIKVRVWLRFRATVSMVNSIPPPSISRGNKLSMSVAVIIGSRFGPYWP